jgi:hypothetical protein
MTVTPLERRELPTTPPRDGLPPLERRAQRPAARRSPCIYCGHSTTRRLACHHHRDLPALDPHYAPELHWPETRAA